MSQHRIEQLFIYVQARYLWQFTSRSWDRTENINGVIATAIDLFNGVEPKKHAPMDRLFYADAQEMVKDFRENFPWINDLEPTRIKELLEGLKAELIDHTITKSRNRELNNSLY